MASKLQMIALQSQYDWVLMQIMQSLSQHPAQAVAMQMAIIVLTPEFIRGPASETAVRLTSSSGRDFWEGREGPWRLAFTRLKSCANIIRAIPITAFRRGDSD